MIKDAKIIGIWGKRGSGKSTCAKGLLKEVNRAIIYDPLWEYDKEGCKAVNNLKQLLIAVKNGWNKGFKIAYQPGQNDDHILNVSNLCDLLMKIQQPYKDDKINQKILFFIEEMSLSVPNRQDPRLQNMLNLCNIGRHYGIEIIGTSQRLAEVHNTFRSNTYENYYLGLSSAVDIEAAAKIIGKEYASQLLSAPIHTGLHWKNGEISKFRNHL